MNEREIEKYKEFMPDTIDLIFAEAEKQIKLNKKEKHINSIKKNNLILYSYQFFRERKNNELFEIISHFNPKLLKEKLQFFINKDKIIIKNEDIYYPSLEILINTNISEKEFYEKTNSFLQNFKYDIHKLNPLTVLYKIISKSIISSRKKYGYDIIFSNL